MVQRPVARNAQQPVPKPAPTEVEPVNPLDGQEPDLLANVFRGASVSTQQVIHHSKDVADVPLVHDGPSRTVAPGHRPQQAEFVVHRPTAPIVWFPLPVYCRERPKSFAIRRERKTGCRATGSIEINVLDSKRPVAARELDVQALYFSRW
jgi:hypothetical protein